MNPTTVLIVLDGWGYREDTHFNAIYHANTPTWDRLWEESSHTLLECSGEHVGLPDGQMGNSEVGHLTLGAGRVIHQELSRIDHSIRDGSLASNDALRSLCSAPDEKTLHVIGLLSPGGVHSHEDHIFAVIELALDRGRRVVLHAILDGRDTPPRSAKASLSKAEALASNHQKFDVGSICGRYYAMDRDRRWDRTQRYFDMLVLGRAACTSSNSVDGLELAYARDESDEFVKPTKCGQMPTVCDGDDVLFMNFRSDRARQLSRAFVTNDKSVDVSRETSPKLRLFATATPYADDIDAGGPYVDEVQALFPKVDVDDTFGEVVAKHGLKQLRIAETEKYAHVTYFFSGGCENEFTGETRKLLSSPNVATYDLQPDMSANAVVADVCEALLRGYYDTIVCNLANADMVGHTGNFDAAKSAVECIDVCLASLQDAVQATGSHLIITADHGNVEKMVDTESAQQHTAHTIGLVPLVYVGPFKNELAARGGLEDVAPTLLQLMDLPQPSAMTGRSLFR